MIYCLKTDFLFIRNIINFKIIFLVFLKRKFAKRLLFHTLFCSIINDYSIKFIFQMKLDLLIADQFYFHLFLTQSLNSTLGFFRRSTGINQFFYNSLININLSRPRFVLPLLRVCFLQKNFKFF